MRTRQEVFIASNFGEFHDLRACLRERVQACDLEAVDLNDNEPSHEPVLEVCLGAVRRSDIFLLLVGSEYGTTPRGLRQSYTHLEYRAACEGDGQPTILVYFIDPLVPGGAEPELAPAMADWRQEIMEHHRVAMLQGGEEPADLAEWICSRVVQVLLASASNTDQLRFDMRSAGEESELLGLEHANLTDAEIERLEEQGAGEPSGEFGDEGVNPQNGLEALTQPAAVAAAEQMQEARKARGLGDRVAAIHHLRRVRDLRPLHLEATFLLARILVGSTALRDLREAALLARRAARIAAFEQRPVREAAAWIVAAQAEAELGNPEDGLECARKAVACAGWISSTHVELACQFARQRRTGQALNEARQAFLCYRYSIVRMNREPALLSLGRAFSDFKRGLLRELRERVGDILREESGTLALLSAVPASASTVDPEERLSKLDSMGIVNLVSEGEASARRHQELLSAQAREVLSWLRTSLGVVVDVATGARAARAKKLVAAGRAGLALSGVLLLGVGVSILGGGSPWEVGCFATVVLLVASIVTHTGSERLGRARTEAAREVRNHALMSPSCSYGRIAAELEERASRFYARVCSFERTTLVISHFSPGTGPGKARVGVLVRLDPGDSRVREGIHLDSSLLPLQFTGLDGGWKEMPTKHVLVRITGENENGLVGERWACYLTKAEVQSFRKEYPLAHESPIA